MPYLAWVHLIPAVREARELGLFGVWRSKPFNKKIYLVESEVLVLDRRLTVPKSSRTRVSPYSFPSTVDLKLEV
jgi:hypothetical protein